MGNVDVIFQCSCMQVYRHFIVQDYLYTDAAVVEDFVCQLLHMLEMCRVLSNKLLYSGFVYYKYTELLRIVCKSLK